MAQEQTIKQISSRLTNQQRPAPLVTALQPEQELKKIFWQIILRNIPDFVPDEYNTKVMRLLFDYALRSPAFEEAGYDLNKGLLIYGPVGSGKTELMRALQQFLSYLSSPLAFSATTILKISESFQEDGFKALQQHYGKNWMFDELGHKEAERAQNYANKVNIADRIINKADERIRYGYVTHFTTNLGPEELADYLDGRTYSRLIKLCNFILLFSTEDHRPNAKAKPLPVAAPAPVVPMFTDADKEIEVLKEIENIKAGKKYRDMPLLYFDYLQDKSLIAEEIPAEVWEEEAVAAVKKHKYSSFGAVGRAILRAYNTDPMNPDNDIYKDIRYRCKVRLLKETIEKLASGALSVELLTW